MLSQIFNKIYVIQSLRPNDRKTGINLYNEISIRLQTENLPVKAEIIDLETLDQFFYTFEKILNQVQYNQVFPIIHIETHGDSQGLELRSGELIGASLIDLLVKINIACKNNLLLTIAACKGAFIVD